MTRRLGNNTLHAIRTDKFFKQSAISGDTPVQLHHVYTFAGKQIDEPWNIVPLTKEEHDMVTPHKPSYIKQLDEQVQLIALNRATKEELQAISKSVDYLVLREYLQATYD